MKPTKKVNWYGPPHFSEEEPALGLGRHPSAERHTGGLFQGELPRRRL